jgi:hypothetical protein
MLGPYPLDSIITGDARQLAQAIPDASVDLIFTDPVYWQIEDYAWLAETAARVLKASGHVLAYCGNVQQVRAGAAMLREGLQDRPVLGHFLMPPYSRLFDAQCHVNYMPLLWFSKPKAQPLRWLVVSPTSSYHGKSWAHEWGKNASATAHFMERFTDAGDVVIDPFAGGGTVPAVCKILERRYLAFEIDPATADKARDRVRDTLPLLDGPDNNGFHLTAAPVGLWDNVDESGAAAGDG